MGDKVTNKRAKYQTCLSIFEREYLRDEVSMLRLSEPHILSLQTIRRLTSNNTTTKVKQYDDQKHPNNRTLSIFLYHLTNKNTFSPPPTPRGI